MRPVEIVGLRTVVVQGVRWDPVVLEVSLRRTKLCVVWLETAIVVIRVVVVTSIVVIARVVTRVACRTIVATRRRLGDVVYNVLLFHECDELIEAVCIIIKLKIG